MIFGCKDLANWKSNFYLEKVNSSYRVNAIYKQKFNVKTLIFAYFSVKWGYRQEKKAHLSEWIQINFF